MVSAEPGDFVHAFSGGGGGGGDQGLQAELQKEEEGEEQGRPADEPTWMNVRRGGMHRVFGDRHSITVFIFYSTG